ncbi:MULTISPECIES: hypothetical protein [Empedobacter]|uniref:hypothetical protein n=1 Tax=Empedobacter TaxID=59734 RepID=UPI001C8D5E0D|nr:MULTISPECIES: hypothetical protein [Empedobacter]MBY0067837.1 hypothetical protein [Empedobacter falsenii]
MKFTSKIEQNSKTYENIDDLIKKSITEILLDNIDIISIAVKNRNKFEGWLKFELAKKLNQLNLRDVIVESKYENSRDRYDLTFMNGDYSTYFIELKTPNTNWNINGVKKCGRPITKNIASIISDTKKLNTKYGIIAFVLFPIPQNSKLWEAYFERIKTECNLPINIEKNCNRINIVFDKEGNNCDLIICSYFAKNYYWYL